MHTVAAGVMEQSIKQSSNNSRQINILPELQLGANCAPKASRKQRETSSLPGPEDREQSGVTYKNADKSKLPSRVPTAKARKMPASSGALGLPVGGLPLPSSCSLPLLGLVSHWHLMKPRAAWLPASLMQQSCTHSPASLLILLP